MTLRLHKAQAFCRRSGQVAAFTWRSLVRQPARAALGIFGIAAVGALLFDMLLLSRGLVLSMQELLDTAGFDIRVTATAAMPGSGPRLDNAASIAARIAALDEVAEATPIRFADADAASGDRPRVFFSIFGADASRRRVWTVILGRDLTFTPGQATGEILVNENLAQELRVKPGDTVTMRGNCEAGVRTAMPATSVRIAGVARFPFDAATQYTAATSRRDVVTTCGNPDDDAADLILIATTPGTDPEAARDAIARADPALAVMTNADVVQRLERSNFSYFRQISTVLATVTTVFGLLLITVLLTVSVNQRLGTIAALRAIGFSARRVMADVLIESALLVGIGGALALPLGFGLAAWLDTILRRMPGIPAEIHFFVFEPRALVVHVAILIVTAVLAAVYPVRLVARLPIAATLRNEVIS